MENDTEMFYDVRRCVKYNIAKVRPFKDEMMTCNEQYEIHGFPATGGTGVNLDIKMKTYPIQKLIDAIMNKQIKHTERVRVDKLTYDYREYDCKLTLTSGKRVFISIVDDDCSCAGHYIHFQIEEILD